MKVSSGREFKSRPARLFKGEKMKKKTKIAVHSLIPKHSKLSETEKKQVLEQYGITVKELPSISLDDAALHGLSVKVSDVLKIERNSPTAGKSVFYRSVIE